MSRPVQLLVSVRGADEALDAVAGGADIVDVKEPTRGPMGMADVAVMAQVVTAVAGRRPVSVAMGELCDSTAFSTVGMPFGIAFAKFAVLPDTDGALVVAAVDQLASLGCRPVVVLYADRWAGGVASTTGLIDRLARRGAGLLLDTATKDGRNVFDHVAVDDVQRLVAQTRAAGVPIALAGSLSGRAFARAVALRPDIVAVRGAACVGNDRQQRVDRTRVAQLRQVTDALCNPPALREGLGEGDTLDEYFVDDACAVDVRPITPT